MHHARRKRACSGELAWRGPGVKTCACVRCMNSRLVLFQLVLGLWSTLNYIQNIVRFLRVLPYCSTDGVSSRQTPRITLRPSTHSSDPRPAKIRNNPQRNRQGPLGGLDATVVVVVAVAVTVKSGTLTSDTFDYDLHHLQQSVCHYALRSKPLPNEGDYVLISVCLSVCLLLRLLLLWVDFDASFLEGWERTDYILVVISITIWLQEFVNSISL